MPPGESRRFRVCVAKGKFLLPINYGKKIYVWQLNFENCGSGIFLTAHIFANGPHFVTLTQPRAAKTGFWKSFRIFSNIFFGILSAYKNFLGACPEKFSHSKFLGTERFRKKFRFSQSSLSVPPKKVLGACTHNFDATDLPNSLFEPLYPKIFQGGPKCWPGVIGLASSTLQSQPILKVVHDFRCF